MITVSLLCSRMDDQETQSTTMLPCCTRLYWKTPMLAWFPFSGLACYCTEPLYLPCFLQPGFSSVHSVPAVYLGVGTTGRRKRFIRSNRHKPPFFCLLSFTANYWYNLSFHYILLSSSLGVLPAQKSPLFFYLPVDFSGAVYTRRKLKYCIFCLTVI